MACIALTRRDGQQASKCHHIAELSIVLQQIVVAESNVCVSLDQDY